MMRRMLILLIALLIMTCCYLVATRSPSYKLFVRPSKHDIRSALGKPSRVFLPNERMGTFGAQPPPPPKGKNEVWVYLSLMKLTYVYFDEHGRVRMIFYTVT